jgi:hypothetical protein
MRTLTPLQEIKKKSFEFDSKNKILQKRNGNNIFITINKSFNMDPKSIVHNKFGSIKTRKVNNMERIYSNGRDKKLRTNRTQVKKRNINYDTKIYEVPINGKMYCLIINYVLEWRRNRY